MLSDARDDAGVSMTTPKGPENDADKPASPWLKQALEYGPLLLFLAIYLYLRDRTVTLGGTDYSGFVVAVVAFVPLQALSTWALKRVTGRVSRMQLVTLGLVVVLGLGTALFNDERVFKMKSTFIFGLFGVLLFIGLWRGQSWLAYVLDQALPLSDEGWMILTKRMAWFFLAFAAMNEAVWRNVSTDTYVLWDTFGQMIVMFVFLISNYGLIAQHWQGEED
jgi:intracellular septation protein